MTVIFGGQSAAPLEALQQKRLEELHHTVGWWCYGLAIGQYLIIALITQRDRISGLLEAFDKEATAVRKEMLTRGAGASAVVCDGDSDDPNLFRSSAGRFD